MMNWLKGNTILNLLLLIIPCTGNYLGSKNHNDFKAGHNGGIGTIPRAMQTSICPKLELYLSCTDYFVAIWDNTGEYVFDSYLDGHKVSTCYDPTKCYLFEIESYSDECEYQVTMDGQVTKTGKLTYGVFRDGLCEDPCPGQSEVVFVTYIEGYGDTNYTFHSSGQGDKEVTIIEGNTKSHCIDIDNCNIMARSKTGWTYFLNFDVNGAFTDSGGFDYAQTFGNCESNCSDATLLISTNERDGDLNISIGTNEAELTNQVLSKGQTKNICIEKSKCTIVDGQGKAHYYFLRDGEVFDKGLSSEYRYFGPCKTKCTNRPALTDTERGQRIVTRLSAISGTAQLDDFNSAPYQSACWLIHDDLQQYSAENPKLVQRYVLSIIYITTNGQNWTTPYGFLTGKDECDWQAVTCTNQLITTLNLESNNLKGTIASETYSLLNLENLRLNENNLYGTIPFGMSNLSMKYFDIGSNRITGSIPEDLFLIDLDYVGMDRNLLTGTIPNEHNNVSKITEIWFLGNLLSGTIPEWIGQAVSLKILYLHYNFFTGKIPEHWMLTELKELRLWNNQLSGTIPSVLFALPSLDTLYLQMNKLSGQIQIPKELTKTSLRNVWLNDNKLTGSIPSKITMLSELNQLYLQENDLSGAIPEEIESLKGLNMLRMEENNLNGTIPFEDCEQFEILSSDCSVPRNITCPCCTRCFGLFTVNKDVLPCPSSILSVKALDQTRKRLEYYVENEDNQLITERYEYVRNATDVIESCISPTDCMTITSIYEHPFSVAVDNIILFEIIEGFGKNATYGYASDGTMKPNTCDEYTICGRSLRPGTPQRKLFNLITRFSGVDIFNDQSEQYEALCWWLSDIDSKTESDQQSTLNVQRYILALMYLSNGGDEWTNNQKWMSSLHECKWHGVSCTIFEGMIDELDLSNNNVRGSLLSELGELRGLERLILNGNDLHGTIPIELSNLKTLELSKSGENDTEWMISFTNVTTYNVAGNNGVPTVSVYFDVSKNKLSDMDTVILDNACNVGSEIADNSVYQMSVDYMDRSNETGVILIGLNTTAIAVNPYLFTDNTLSFCVRADMTGRSEGYDESISFTETILTLNFDFAAGFEIENVSLEGIEAKKVNKTESFNVDACICTLDGNNATCLAKKLKQNSEFDLCFFSLSDVMEIDSVTSMEMEQNGIVKFSPIVISRTNPFTQVFTKQVYSKQDSKGAWKVYNAARVSSRVVSAFFVDKKLEPVIIKGSVLLAFAGSTPAKSRKLLEDVKDTHESQFAAKVLLDDGSAMIEDETTESNTKSNMLTLVAIIAACVAVIAFAIVMYLKKKN